MQHGIISNVSSFLFIAYLPTLRRKSKKLLLFSGIIVIVSALTIGCSGDSANTTQPEIYFPVQKEVLAWHLLVPLEGELLLDDNGRLRVMGDLILWPYGYSLNTEGKKIWVINDKGQRTVRVGDRIR